MPERRIVITSDRDGRVQERQTFALAPEDEVKLEEGKGDDKGVVTYVRITGENVDYHSEAETRPGRIVKLPTPTSRENVASEGEAEDVRRHTRKQSGAKRTAASKQSDEQQNKGAVDVRAKDAGQGTARGEGVSA